MYDGTTEMSAADTNPAPEPRTSLMNKNVANAQNAAKTGAVKTQTSWTSMGMCIQLSKFHTAPAVKMRPGYIVPPMTRPSGYQVNESKKFHVL